MKVVGYLRVSTDRQAERGLGLDVQRQAIRGWAKCERHSVVRWCSDEGVSGSNGVSDRPALAEALTLVADGQATGLVVARLDRLARSLSTQEAILAELWRAEGHAFSVDTGEVLRDDPNDPMRTAMRQMAGVFAQLDRAMIAARMRAGRERKRERGGYYSGAPPYGYRADDGQLIANPDEQRVIARMRELDASGHPQHEIAGLLNAEGHHTKQGRPWSRVAVGLVLRRQEVR